MNTYTLLIRQLTAANQIWLRELPSPLLQEMTKDDLKFDKPEDCATSVMKFVTGEKQTILRWLVRLLQYCASQSRVNKMSPENLAIVVGPNLMK